MFTSWRRWLRQTFRVQSYPRRKTPRRLRLWLEPLEDRTLPSTFTVINTNDSGPGSLRDAIAEVNLDPDPGTDTIEFHIGSGVQTIALLSALPTVTHVIVIDGTTQAGFAGTPLIELNGAGAGPAANGLRISAGGSTVQGLVINRFSRDGILLEGRGGDLVMGNYVGTDVTGALALGNGGNGVELSGISDTTVGGTTAAARNLISGNRGDGVLISNGAGVVTAGNYIGTDARGTSALGNAGHGVHLIGCLDNLIGGTEAGAGNLISGNQGDGLFSFGGARNLVQGNTVGTDVTGTRALGNVQHGLELRADNNDTVGGTTAAARNLISGNGGNGLTIAFGTHLVEGNYIGTDVTGTRALGNSFGIQIGQADGVTIGGTEAGAGNLISGNRALGIHVSGGQRNVVQGNTVGTDVTGTQPLGNGGGVVLQFESTDIIGGTAGAGNLISANKGDGIALLNSITGTLVQGTRSAPTSRAPRPWGTPGMA